jgi:hypothetical protein
LGRKIWEEKYSGRVLTLENKMKEVTHVKKNEDGFITAICNKQEGWIKGESDVLRELKGKGKKSASYYLRYNGEIYAIIAIEDNMCYCLGTDSYEDYLEKLPVWE